MKRQAKPSEKLELPEGVLPSDLKWTGEELDYEVGEHGSITMHRTERFGWVIATLPISKGKRGAPDRTYGIPVSGSPELVSVGNGPHVTKTIVIRAKKSRSEALRPFHDMYVRGLLAANGTRDRISSRRAQGQRMRDLGRSSWRWDT